MPIRGEEIRVTDEDITAANGGGRAAQRSHESLRAANLQRVVAFIQTADSEELTRIRQALDRKEGRAGAGAGMVDRTVLGVYVNVVPWVLSFAVVMPLAIFGGWFYQRIKASILMTVYSADMVGLTGRIIQNPQMCPPDCNWLDIAAWGTAVGMGLLVSLFVANGLRRRLIRATRK